MSEEMYGRRARLYDLIYAGKDYAGEAKRLRKLLGEHGVDDGATLLEAACGTGNYVKHLGDWYNVAGFDISPEMLELAQQKLPDVELFEADMFAFDSERTYDAVVCLFSSLSYARSLEQLEEEYRQALEKAGFEVHYDAQGLSGRGLWVARRVSSTS